MSGPATPHIIRHVTQALLRIVHSGMPSDVRPEDVVAAPPEMVSRTSSGQIVALYLYRVVESPDLKNQGPHYESAPAVPPDEAENVVIRRDPLALNLHYLLIPFGADESFLETYELLGLAMKSLHDNSNFTLGEWPDLVGLTEEEAKLEFRIVPEPLTISELGQIWEAVHEPYRLSVSYALRTVQIKSDDEETIRRVVARRLAAGQDVPQGPR